MKYFQPALSLAFKTSTTMHMCNIIFQDLVISRTTDDNENNKILQDLITTIMTSTITINVIIKVTLNIFLSSLWIISIVHFCWSLSHLMSSPIHLFDENTPSVDGRPAYPKILLSLLRTAYVHIFRFLTGFFLWRHHLSVKMKQCQRSIFLSFIL